MKNSRTTRRVWFSGLLDMLVHNYAHFDALFVQSSLVALGMGLVTAIVWGVTPGAAPGDGGSDRVSPASGHCLVYLRFLSANEVGILVT